MFKPGTVGTTSGYRAVVIRQHNEGMVELRLQNGAVCVANCDFIPQPDQTNEKAA
jgi:hypothetical protein